VVDGKSEVSLSGGATYTIPIKIPPGTNGVVPSVSVSYNSQGGDGNMGFGWNVAVGSMVSRGNKDPIHDGYFSGIDGSKSDILYLDGQRLILCSGNYGEDASTYTTEMEGYSVITLHNNSDNANAWLEVLTRTGSKLEYGKADYSILKNPLGVPILWYLNKMTDVNGNYILYNYKVPYQGIPLGGGTPNDLHELKISEILYTGNQTAGLLPYNKIRFEYKQKEKFTETYELGQSFTNKYVVEKIIITGEAGANFKTYTFKYGKDNIYSYMNEVEEAGANGGKLNTTIFKYGDEVINDVKEQLTLSNSSTIIDDNVNLSVGEFNGIGKTEIVVEKYAAGNKNFAVESNIFKFNTLSDYTTYNYSTYSCPNSYPYIAVNINFKNDFNGDGKEDFLSANGVIDANSTFTTTNYPNGVHPTLLNYFTLNTDNSNSFLQNNFPLPTNFNYFVNTQMSNAIGDFDGDGVNDFIYFGFGTDTSIDFGNGVLMPMGGFRAFFYSSKNSFVPKNINKLWDPYNISITNPIKTNLFHDNNNIDFVISTADFNGDGKSELIIQQTFNTLIFTFTPTSNGGLEAKLIHNLGFGINSSTKLFFGDFNGDGKSDILVNKYTGMPFILYTKYVNNLITFEWKDNIDYSTFPSHLKFYNNDILMSGLTHVADQLIVADVNADGKSDLVNIYKEDNSGTVNSRFVDVFYSTGNDFLKITSQVNDVKNYYNGNGQFIYNPFLPADMIGDGQTDFIYKSNNSNRPISVLYIKPLNANRIIEKILDGHGNLVTFNYRLLTEAIGIGGMYSFTSTPYSVGLGYAPEFPINRLQLAQYIVNKYNLPNGINFNTTEFKYTNAAYHRQGKGFLGFESITSINSESNLKLKTYNSIQSWDYLALPNPKMVYLAKNDSVQTYQLDNNTLLATKYTYNNYKFNANGSISNVVDYVHDINYYKGTYSFVWTSVFDAWRNPKEQMLEVGIGYNWSPVQRDITTYTYNNANTHSCTVPTLPLEFKQSKTRTGSPTITHSSTIGYDTKGRVTNTAKFVGEPLLTNMSISQYDVFGNALATSSSSGTLPVQTSTVMYDPKGRFASSTTQNGLLTNTYTYSPLWGSVVSANGHDCIATRSTYDEFGRETSAINYAGTPLASSNIINKQYNWEVVNAISSLYKVTTYGAGMPTNIVRFDKLGREKQAETQGFNNLVSTKETTYDAKGNVETVTQPHSVGDIYTTSTYTYDTKNRLIQTNNGLVKISTSYTVLPGGKFNTTTKNLVTNQEKTTETDATGLVTQSQDHGGKLRFTYNSLGKNTFVVRIGGGTSIFNVIDAYGRTKKTADANAGTYEYEYDNYNRLIQQKNPNGHVSTLTYDNFGKVLTKTGVEGTTTYEYGGNGTSCQSQLLASIIDFAGNTEEYTYDVYNRNTESIKIIDGMSYTFNTEFDDYGNVIQKTYPSGLVVENQYDALGYLHSVNYANSINDPFINVYTAI
jgi:YD repeat-containing protein